MEVLWFGYMEEVVCNGDDLILNPLFNVPDSVLNVVHVDSGSTKHVTMCRTVFLLPKAT